MSREDEVRDRLREIAIEQRELRAEAKAIKIAKSPHLFLEDRTEVSRHLMEAHGDRAPFGYAFADERPNENRAPAVHRWCHREDGTIDHD